MPFAIWDRETGPGDKGGDLKERHRGRRLKPKHDPSGRAARKAVPYFIMLARAASVTPSYLTR
jgi:hypothetical protein